MAEDQKQKVDEKELGSNDDQFEILEGRSERSDSNSTDEGRPSSDDLSDLSIPERDLEQHTAGGLEVHAADVITIQEQPDISCYESDSCEELEATVFIEYPSESDEEYCSPFPQPDCGENLRFQESGMFFEEVDTVPWLDGSERNKSVYTPREENSNVDASNSETTSGSGSQEVLVLHSTRYSHLDTPYNTAEVIEPHRTPIYEFTSEKPKTKQSVPPGDFKHNVGNLGCNSDEFADIEDNSESPTESELSSNATESNAHLSEANPSVDEVTKEETFDGKEELKKAGVDCSSNDSVGSAIANSDFPQPSCSYTPQHDAEPSRIFPIEKIAEASKGMEDQPMDTITEMPELVEENGRSRTNKPPIEPPVSKTNPLKMKSSVVKNKNKCNVCNAKLGLCPIVCRCGGSYCAKHRYDREHNCTFDYKSMGAEQIRKNNPQIVAEKVRKL